nr:hypothetical protein 2 [bacterium]
MDSGLDWEKIEEIGIGYLRLDPRQLWRLTFRQFDQMVQQQLERDQDKWDYVRTIIAGYRGGDPKKYIRLKRDKVVVTSEMKDKAKELIEQMRAKHGAN